MCFTNVSKWDKTWFILKVSILGSMFPVREVIAKFVCNIMRKSTFSCTKGMVTSTLVLENLGSPSFILHLLRHYNSQWRNRWNPCYSFKLALRLERSPRIWFTKHVLDIVSVFYSSYIYILTFCYINAAITKRTTKTII